MKFSIVLCALFLCFGLFAQTPEAAPLQISVSDFNHKPIEKDKIIFIGQKSKKQYTAITDKLGKAFIKLPSGEIYDIKIDALGEAMEYNTLEVPAIPSGYAFETMELFIEYDMPESITLSNLHFETGKSNLKPESIPQLDQLVDYLKRKTNLIIKIVGHTDNVGDDYNNLQLSQSRADVVMKYLIDHGISASRLQSKGFGETMPVADNNTAEGRAKNRRTEIQIVTK